MINTSEADRAKIDLQTITNIDFLEVARYFLPIELLTHEKVHGWVERYLSCDRAELARRGAITRELALNPESLGVLGGIEETANEIRRSYRQLTIRQGQLSQCSLLLKLGRLCVDSMDTLTGFLSGFKGSELMELARQCDEINRSKGFGALRRAVEKTQKYFSPLSGATVALNYTEAEQLYELVIDSLDTEAPPPGGLIPGGEQAGGFLRPVRGIDRGRIIQLENQIIKSAQWRWSTVLGRASADLLGVKLKVVGEWLQFISGAEYFIAAVKASFAFERRSCPLCVPGYSENGLSAEELYNPHIALMADSELPIPCGIAIGYGGTSIITGANSSGKTTFIKSITQGLLLAQLGFSVPAVRFDFRPVRRFRSVFSAGEDMDMRASRFQKEAKELKAVLDSADDGTFILLNEPFTSTNPAEAAELFVDVIVRLELKRSTQLVVTHLYDVFYALAAKGRDVKSYRTVTEADGDSIRYTYRVIEEEPDMAGYARIIAREHGLDPRRFIDNPDILDSFREFTGNTPPVSVPGREAVD